MYIRPVIERKSAKKASREADGLNLAEGQALEESEEQCPRDKLTASRYFESTPSSSCMT